jgi:hypothetical protein
MLIEPNGKRNYARITATRRAETLDEYKPTSFSPADAVRCGLVIVPVYLIIFAQIEPALRESNSSADAAARLVERICTATATELAFPQLTRCAADL